MEDGRWRVREKIWEGKRKRGGFKKEEREMKKKGGRKDSGFDLKNFFDILNLLKPLIR